MGWEQRKGGGADERLAKPGIRGVDGKGGFEYCTNQVEIKTKPYILTNMEKTK